MRIPRTLFYGGLCLLTLAASCRGGDSDGMCSGQPLCTLAMGVQKTGGNCNTGGNHMTFDEATCMNVASGACGSSADQGLLCQYMQCIIAGPTCVAGQEAAYISADAHCVALYAMLSSGCQAAIVAATQGETTGDGGTGGTGDPCLALPNEGSCDYTAAPLNVCRQYTGNYPLAEVQGSCPGANMTSLYQVGPCKAGSVGHCSIPDSIQPKARCQLVYYYPPMYTTASAQTHCTMYEKGTFYGP